MDMCRDWESEKEGIWVLEEENGCGFLSLTAESVRVSQCWSEGHNGVDVGC